MGEHRNYGLSDDRPPLSYIDDFSMGEIAYGAYEDFDTNAVPVPYMENLEISSDGLGAVLYQGTWEDEDFNGAVNGLGIHGSRAGAIPTYTGTVAAPLPFPGTVTDLIKPAIVKSDPATMVANETGQRNQVLLWGGLAIAALMFLGPK